MWLRLGACAIVAAVATSVVGNLWPVVWVIGLAPVIMFDGWVFGRLLKQCLAGEAPRRIPRIIAWTAAQSIYGNLIAVLLWFSPYVPGETLAIIYMFGGLANAAATLRSSVSLSIAGAGSTIAFLLGLPLADYLINGARNPLDLMPLMGGLLLLAFGVNLWKSLLASDAAHYGRNRLRRSPFPIVYHVGDMLRGFDRLRLVRFATRLQACRPTHVERHRELARRRLRPGLVAASGMA